MSRLVLSDLSVRYNGTPVIRNVGFRSEPGELVGLIGANGAGKTTLLRAAANLLRFTGTARLDDRPIAAWPRRELARRLAYLAQGHDAHWPMPVEDVVGLGRLPHMAFLGQPAAADREAIARAMEKSETVDLAHRNVMTLSAGERARVMLARALAVEAPLLLADEPTAALDPYHQLHIMEVLQAEAQAGRAVVVVLHDLTLAARFCDRLVLLGGGRVIADGPADNVLTDDNLAKAYGISVLQGGSGDGRFVVPWHRLPG
ncbi:MAG TPA: ABC transporter ATP-binding protein [Alphaproteobacteria bacterium]|nr:ABC transporter ATP-binding protein [Alphaproteobacteria bacterium]